MRLRAYSDIVSLADASPCKLASLSVKQSQIGGNLAGLFRIELRFKSAIIGDILLIGAGELFLERTPDLLGAIRVFGVELLRGIFLDESDGLTIFDFIF